VDEDPPWRRGARDRDALVWQLGSPPRLWEEARFRWDRPIQATLEIGGPFNGFPRWPFEVAAVARRAPEIARALRKVGAAWRAV
jgi:hypothetical protein